MSIVIDIAAQFTGKKAFTQAENAADKLARNVKQALIGVGVTAFATANNEAGVNLTQNNSITAAFAAANAATATDLTQNNLFHHIQSTSSRSGC